MLLLEPYIETVTYILCDLRFELCVHESIFRNT